MAGGWVAISRKIMDSPDLRTPMERWAMVWMIIHAAVKPGCVRTSKASVDLERGQLTHSTRHLAAEWGMSEASVRRLLTKLEKRRTIRRQRDAEGDAGQVVVTLCNYDDYQLTDAKVTQMRREGDAEATQNITKEQSSPSEKKIDMSETRSDSSQRKASRRKGALRYSARFEELWAVWGSMRPNQSKAEASRIFEALDDERQQGALIAAPLAAQRYRAAGTEPQFIPHLTTWLRQRRFDEFVEYDDDGETEVEPARCGSGRDGPDVGLDRAGNGGMGGLEGDAAAAEPDGARGAGGGPGRTLLGGAPALAAGTSLRGRGLAERGSGALSQAGLGWLQSEGGGGEIVPLFAASYPHSARSDGPPDDAEHRWFVAG